MGAAIDLTRMLAVAARITRHGAGATAEIISASVHETSGVQVHVYAVDDSGTCAGMVACAGMLDEITTVDTVTSTPYWHLTIHGPLDGVEVEILGCIQADPADPADPDELLAPLRALVPTETAVPA